MREQYEDRYIELTTRLRSVEAFCDFLARGGTVRVAETDGAPFVDVTSVLLDKQRKTADALRQKRRHLFPDRADEDFQPSLYTRH